MSKVAYLDTSAIFKLVAGEPETGALIEALPAWEVRVSSMLARVEVMLAAVRIDRSLRARADEVLADLNLIPVDEVVLTLAEGLTGLRALDAIHVATALSLDIDLVLVTYDRRMVEAAGGSGLRVESPA